MNNIKYNDRPELFGSKEREVDVFNRVTHICNLHRLRRQVLCSAELVEPLRPNITRPINGERPKFKYAGIVINGFIFIPKEELNPDEFVVFGNHALSNLASTIEDLEHIDQIIKDLSRGKSVWVSNASDENDFSLMDDLIKK